MNGSSATSIEVTPTSITRDSINRFIGMQERRTDGTKREQFGWDKMRECRSSSTRGAVPAAVAARCINRSGPTHKKHINFSAKAANSEIVAESFATRFYLAEAPADPRMTEIVICDGYSRE